MESTASLARIKKGTIAVILVYLTTYYGFLLIFRHGYMAAAISDLMAILGEVLSIIIMILSLQFFYSRKAKHIWMVFIAGAVFYLIADSLSTYNELVRGVYSFASTSDYWYTISAFLILVGFFLHIPQKSKYSLARSGFDVLIVMVMYLSLDLKYVLLPIMANVVLTGSEKLAALMYPIFDVGLFIAFLLIYISNDDDGSFFKSKLLLLIAGVWLFADQSYSIQSILGIYEPGSWLDPFWSASFLGLAYVSLQSAQFHLKVPESPEESEQGISSSILKSGGFFTYGAMIIFMIVWSFKYFEQDPLSIGGIIIILLLIIRQWFALLENRRLVQLLIQSNAELQEAKLRIEYELKTDYLTRLFNRRYVDVTLAELQKASRVKPSTFSVLVLDIDHFKNVNDRYGHSTGDQVLQQIARIIGQNIRKDDIAARWGGEEFIILLPDTGEAMAYSIGERIRQEIAANYFISDSGVNNIKLSVSIGLSEVDPYEQDFCKVLLRADQGMYEAKYSGRNKTVIKRVG
jgi:diguanylate cyclase (GGDEF) domain